MKLQTQIPLEIQKVNQIDYHSKLLLLGSCFVETIGEKLEYFKFQTVQNPFGIVFHPKAIETLIYNASHHKTYTEKDIFYHNEQWHCYDAHSRLSSAHKEELLMALNSSIGKLLEQLVNATHIIFTFGTAWIYRHYKSNLPVANCHKVPQNEFVKELLSIDEITNSIKLMVTNIRHVNPTATVMFTVSPVRHLKDGFVENSRSKAHLIAAIHHFLNEQSSINHHHCCYFPSYEILLDELREYRFYDEDMLHPNKTAINYIWQRFQNVWISKDSHDIINEIDAIQTGLLHRAFQPNSNAHQQFLKQLDLKKERIHAKFPHIIF